MAQQHTGATQQGDTAIEKHPLGFFSCYFPATTGPWEPGIWSPLWTVLFQSEAPGLQMHLVLLAGDHSDCAWQGETSWPVSPSSVLTVSYLHL